MNGREVNPEEFLIDGAEIKTFHLKEETIMLSEIFRYIDFNPQAAFGKRCGYWWMNCPRDSPPP